MEPAAPGTEDDVVIIPSLYKKKETLETHLLSLKAQLPNGETGNVFEQTIVNGSEHWYCNLCECPILGRIYHHQNGKRHSSYMAEFGIENPNSEPEPPMQVAPGEPLPPGFEDHVEKVAAIQEHLDKYTVDPIIGLEYLFEITEYDLDKEPFYLCSLCDKRGDPRTVLAHLGSYNHMSQYLQRHFLKAFRALQPYMTKQYKRNWQTVMQKIAEAIEALYGRLKPHVVDKDSFEKKRASYQNIVAKGPHFSERFGATFEELVIKEDMIKVTEDDPPQPEPKRNYRKSGTDTAEDANRRSPSPPVVAKPKKPTTLSASGEKSRDLSSVSSISSSDLSDFDPSQATPTKENKVDVKPKQPLTKNRQFRKYKQSPPPTRRGRFYQGSNQNYNDEKSKRVLPWQRSDYRSRDENPVPEREKNKFDKQAEFKKLSAAIEKDMDRILKQHEKHPEKHPQYNDEWKKFWNQRYKELQAEGKNPAAHDFKPEWINCWNKRLKEIHGNELKSKKEALRKRLGIPDEPASICFRITGKKRPGTEEAKMAPMASAPDFDPEVIVIDDVPEKKKRTNSPWENESGRSSRRSPNSRSRSGSFEQRRSRTRSPRNRKRRSRSRRSRSREIEWPGRDLYHHDYPRPIDKMYFRGDYPPDYIMPPRVMRDVTRHPVVSPPHGMLPQEAEPEDDGDMNIVSVLRLLTALEEKLGSLGPKVIDLLSKALAMEKAEANSSETLLDNDVHCVLFETVKEKLKGQLLAGLVNSVQEKAFKIAIKKIASLVYVSGEKRKEKEQQKPKPDPIQVPGVGKVDKGAIAKQIAAALIEQGKTDVTQAELEQLINAVVGMAEASQQSNKPMTTASFLEKISKPKVTTVVEKKESIGFLQNVLQKPSDSAITTSTSSMEGLSDSDLQTLLQNFKDLCTDEQHSLISYLKKLEAREPQRVERLRKFVKLETSAAASEKETDVLIDKSDDEVNGKVSPFANRFARSNPSIVDEPRTNFSEKPRIIEKVTIDSDEEDYTFEDVFKAANKNVKEKEEKEKEEKERLKAESKTMFKNEDFDVSNASSLIANIMGQFRSKTKMPTTVLNQTPSVFNQTPSVLNQTPSDLNQTPSVPNQTQTVLNQTPTAVSVVPPPQPPSVPPPQPPSVPPPQPPQPPTLPLPSIFPNPGFLDNIPINIASITNALNTAQQIRPSIRKPQIQPPIVNQNVFSLQPQGQPNNMNVNPNSFSLQTNSERNFRANSNNFASKPNFERPNFNTDRNVNPNIPFRGGPERGNPFHQQENPYFDEQRQQYNNHNQPPRFDHPQNQNRPSGNNFQQRFNRPMRQQQQQQPNQFSQRQEYFDEYDERW